MNLISYIQYVPFIAITFWISSFFMFRVDKNNYDNSGMKREQKTVKFLVWINLCLGTAVFVGGWLYNTFVW